MENKATPSEDINAFQYRPDRSSGDAKKLSGTARNCKGTSMVLGKIEDLGIFANYVEN